MDNDRRRIVVSVAFPPDDLAAVHKSAKRSGMRLSEFIRQATMDKLAQSIVLVSGASNNATVWAGHVPGATL